MSSRIIALLFGIMLFTSSASAEFGVAWEIPWQGSYVFVGSANMDADYWEELVYGMPWEDTYVKQVGVYQFEQLLIIDGATGNIDWNSSSIGITRIFLCNGFAYANGKVPFCDINGDGKKEITFAGAKGDWNIYLVGYNPEDGGITSLANTPNME